MNKKVLAILMALAMIISIVPMTAMAAEEHEHDYYDHVVSNNDGTHGFACSCDVRDPSGFSLDCMDPDGDGACDSCGWIKYVHECTMDKLVSISETQHQFQCTCGKLVSAAMNHNDGEGDGKCDSCGYQMYTAPEEEHEHNYIAHSNNDGTHLLTCNCGLEVKSVTCLDNDGDGKCDSCGYQKYTAPEGGHEHNYIAHSNNDGTHLLTCNCGLEVKSVTCLDNDGDGKCDSCGYQKYTAPEGGHEHNYVPHSNNDGTHTSSCSCGLEVKDIKCSDPDGDGFCDSCGYLLYVPTCVHKNQGAADNKDGLSHNIVCRDCTKTLTVKVAHEYVNGTCVCGAVEPHKCTYEAGVTSNNDGTHNINCSCGDYVQVGCLDNDGDGKCDSCGYVKYKAPEKTDASDANLDKVPRTGSIFIEWLYALIFG